MTAREFRTMFRDVDAVVVTVLWDVYLHSRWDMREKILAALGQLEAKAQVTQFRARGPRVPPPPAAVPHLVPPAS